MNGVETLIDGEDSSGTVPIVNVPALFERVTSRESARLKMGVFVAASSEEKIF